MSPLLANIALHGIEEALTVRRTLKNGRVITTADGVKYNKSGHHIGKRAVVKYADDFAVFCESQQDAERVTHILKEWLSERGLTLSPEKTKIVHLSEGFDFLGFNIRHYKNPTRKTGRTLLIKPSNESVQKIRDRLRDEWYSLRGQSVTTVIRRLNPIIRGWANYHRIGVAARIFNKLDRWMFQRQVRHVKHTHPRKPRYWRQAKYWGRLNLARNDHWVFGDKRTGTHLLKFSWFPIERHVLVQGDASADDPNLRGYWARREAAKAKDLAPSRAKIARRQNGRCPKCAESLFNGEEVQAHHREWKSEGGKDTYGNLELVHLFCHQQIHAKGPVSALDRC